jgi:hypothetical protein
MNSFMPRPIGPRRHHGRHAKRGPLLSEGQTVAGISAVMAVLLGLGVLAHDDGKTYAFDAARWEYSGDSMVCRRPQPWSGEAFSLAASVRTCLSIWDPKVKEENDACPAES